MFAPMLTMCVLFAYFYKERIRFIYIVGIGAFVISFALVLASLRAGELDFADVSMVDLFFGGLLYGNTFSDLRDFAWVLTGFHDDFLLGKTYLSGWLSFFPSGFFEYRRLYGLGIITNFGFLGVVAVGGLLGYLLQKLNNSLQWAIETGKDAYYFYSKILVFSMLSTAITISSGLPFVYTIIGIHFLWKVVDTFFVACSNRHGD